MLRNCFWFSFYVNKDVEKDAGNKDFLDSSPECSAQNQENIIGENKTDLPGKLV